MSVSEIKAFLDSNHVVYEAVPHARVYTAAETAQAAHVPGQEMAKTVLVIIDGRLVMAVVPSNCRLDEELLRQAAHADEVRLADEREFFTMFPDCELGAMPPLGNLYHLDVYIDSALDIDDEIAFNAGTHTEIIRMPFSEFRRVVRPIIAPLSV